MHARPVSADDLERSLAELKTSVCHPHLGIFGPDSVTWKVNRESALFLAAGRAALLQLAHPWVAAAIAQHSRTLDDPIGRFHGTFRVMFAMSYGSVDHAFAAARRLHRMHGTIRGAMPDGVARFAAGSVYQANEAEALVWVYATLIDSSMRAYELAMPPLTADERETYYAENRRAAALFGILPDELPPNLSGLREYMRSAFESDMLGVSGPTRQLAHRLHEGAGRLRTPFWYRALTTQLLPPRFREEFAFAYGDRERRAAERALRWIRRLYPHLLPVLRFVGPYNEAVARLEGRSRPSAAVRLSNRLWIGQPMLLPPRVSP
jgi:uncharacterized protein (DUF2236 family)